MKPVWAYLGRSLYETLHGSRDVLNKTTKRDGITVLVLDLDLALVFHIAFPLVRRLVQSRRQKGGRTNHYSDMGGDLATEINDLVVIVEKVMLLR